MDEIKLQKIEELFLTYGVRSVSMDDIARHLGISKKTLYQHFKDKNELVEIITRKVINDRQSEYEEVTCSASNAIEELFFMSKCLRKHFAELNPSLIYDLKKFYPEAWEVFMEYEHVTVFESIRTNLDKGIEEGYFRKEINKEVLAKLRVEQVHMSFDPHVFPKTDYDFTEVQMQMFDHFVYGLLTPEGTKQYEKYKKENI